MRRSELDDLDGKAPLWTVPAERAKRQLRGKQADKPHHVPLTPQAVAVIRRRIAEVDLMFPPDDDEQPEAFDCLFPARAAATGQDVPIAWGSNWMDELRDEMRSVACDDDGRVLGPGEEDPRWTAHGIRHTLGTLLVAELGVTLHVADLILGHTLPTPTAGQVTSVVSKAGQIYIRAPFLEERRAALARWAQWLERLAEPAAKVLSFRRRASAR